jgi:surfactin synthase thioesterase subunit
VRAREFSCPPVPELMAQARLATRDAPDEATLRAEIADRSSEALRALSMAGFVPRGAARISLAAGTAFAVLVLALVTREAPMTAVIGALVAFTGGCLGAVAAANIGHRARTWASEQRTLWVRAVREAERAIERS